MVTWPNEKRFAFTIIDDTDFATSKNIKPVYDYLYKRGLKTTKTVWCYPSRDRFKGETLTDLEYRLFIESLNKLGYEIAFHGPGSGHFNRKEIINSLNLFKDVIGHYPKMHINHASNPEGLYWGKRRFSALLAKIYDFIKWAQGKSRVVTSGEIENSEYFWGDYAKENIKYIRNRVYSPSAYAK